MTNGVQAVVSKLDQLIGVTQRIEKLLEKSQTAPGQPGQTTETASTPKNNLSADDVAKLASLSTALSQTIKAINESGKIDPKKGKDVADFMVNFSEKINDIVKDVDEAKLNSFTKILDAVTKGAGTFIKDMALLAILTPIAMVGAAGFSVTLVIMTKILAYASTIDEETTKGLESVMKIAKGAFLFGLSLAGFLLISPLAAAGALAFVTVLAGLSVGLNMATAIAGDGEGFNKGPLGSLLKMAKGVAMFMLVLVGIALLAPVVALGTLTFILVITGLSLGLKLASAIAGDGEGFNKGPLGSLMKMGKGIGLFMLVLVGIALLAPVVALGALTFILVITGIALGLKVVDAIVGKKKGEGPVDSLLQLAKATVIFSAVFILVGLFFIKPFAAGALAVILAMMAIAPVVLLMGLPLIKKGSQNLRHLSVSLIAFSAALAIYGLFAAPNLEMRDIGILAAAIGVMALVGTVLGVPPINKWVESGAGALIVLGGALIVFSAGLAIYAQLAAPKLTWESVAILGGVIGVMSLIGTLIGIPPIVGFVIAGAAALIVLGIGLIAISSALSIFAQSGFKQTDGDNLKYALHSIILGMFGYEKIEDIGIGAAVWIPALTGFLILTSAAFIVASVALMPISKALSIFKQTGWGKEDSDSLKNALMSIGGAFASIAEGDNWENTKKGIFGMRDVGGTLISIAAGIQSMANMTFTEYEWDETTKKLEPKRKVKLTEDDVKLAASNAASVISVLAEPFAKFGAFISGKAMFEIRPGVFMKSDFQSVMQGIASIGGLGASLSSLASGVSAWAEMSYFEYGMVYNPQTKMEELKPIAKKKMNPEDITRATTNIASVLSAMITPIADWGLMMMGGSLSSGPFVALGLSSAKNNIEKGIESIGILGTSLKNLAEGVLGFANMSFTEYEVQTIDGKKQLVPKAVIKVDETLINQAIGNISSVISVGATALLNYVKKLEESGMDPDDFADVIESVIDMSKGFGTVYKEIETTFNDPGKIIATTNSFKTFFESVLKPFDIKSIASLGVFNKMFESYITNIDELSQKYTGMDLLLKPALITKYNEFATITEKLAKISTPFEKFVKSFGEMAKHMGVFATNFKVMDAQGILAFKDWTGSMVEISKVDVAKSEGIVNFINDAVSAAFGGGGSSEVAADKKPQAYTESEKQSQIKSQLSKDAPGTTPEAAAAASKIDTAAITAAITAALANLTVEHITVTGDIVER